MGKKDLGLVHIYCGDGKGKTTCSVGLTVRASGYGLHVLFMQFLKDGTSSELKVLRKLEGIEVLDSTPIKKFAFQMNDEEKEETRQINKKQLENVYKMVNEEKYDMLVIDECLGAIESGLLSEADLIEFLNKRPSELEIVLTGRNPSEQLIELADYVSRIDKVKHPFDKGIPARDGIES